MLHSEHVPSIRLPSAAPGETFTVAMRSGDTFLIRAASASPGLPDRIRLQPEPK